jgi:hypothetical protein
MDVDPLIVFWAGIIMAIRKARIEVKLDKSDFDHYFDSTQRLVAELNATIPLLQDRERELLELKGPCSTCTLHYAHSGPCASNTKEEQVDESG